MTKNFKEGDLEIIGMDLININFKKEGYDLLVDYVGEKLKEDGVDLKFNFDDTAVLGKKKYDFSDKTKKETFKELVAKAIVEGENKGFNNYTPLGEWLNHIVEYLSIDIINMISSRVENKIQDRIYSLWTLWGFEKDKYIKDNYLVDVNKINEIFERLIRNTKKIKTEVFEEVNTYVN